VEFALSCCKCLVHAKQLKFLFIVGHCLAHSHKIDPPAFVVEPLDGIQLTRNGSHGGWVQSLDWTTGLTQTAKYNSFSAEQKVNVLIPSVTSLTLLPTASFLEFSEVKGHVHI